MHKTFRISNEWRPIMAATLIRTPFFKRMTAGLSGGMIATLPMTLWMVGANKAIPTDHPDPLPPEQITTNLAEKMDVADAMTKRQKEGLSLVNHFAYGAVIATPLALLFAPKGKPGRLISLGVGYGFLVWLANYLGLMPAVRLYPSAKDEPQRMNGIMIIAHLIWGAALGGFLAAVNRR
jgi:uncharacterized membrane protein YagU involved in acid resistance